MTAEAQIKRELLECPVCHEHYNDSDRTPRLPPCRHSHCSKCLSELLCSDIFKCTLCNATHLIKDRDIANIPKNNTLRQLMDIMNRKESKKCDGCDENATAVCYCERCKEYLCKTCSDAHRRVRATKSHSLCDLNNHEDEAAINDEFRKKQEEMLNLIRDLEHVNIDSYIKKLRKTGEKLKQNSEQLKDIISRQFEQYIKAISTQCRILKEKTDWKTNGKVEELSHAADMLEKHKPVLVSKLSEAQTLLQCTDGVAFLKDYNSIMREMEKIQTDLRMSVDTSEVHFVACPADDFNKIVNALGTVEDSVHVASIRESMVNVQGEERDMNNGVLNAESDVHASVRELHSGQFLEVLKSLLESENAVEHKEVTEASGGTPEVDDQSGNPDVVMGNLKDFIVESKHVKDCIPHGKLCVINTPTVRQMINMRFETLKLHGYWEIEGDILTVRSRTLDEAERCMEVLVETVLEETVCLPKGSEIIVDTDKWQIVNNRLNKKYKDQVKVQVLHETNSVGIYATCTSALKDACDTVRIFLRDNFIKFVTLEYQEQVVKFIMRRKSQLKKICESNSQYFVSVNPKGRNTILVKGIGFGLCRSVRLVHGLANRFKGISSTCDEDEERFDSDDEEDDEERLSDDEATAEDVNVEVNMTLVLANKETLIKTLCLPGDDRVIFTVVGDITTLPVEVVINPANQSLKHNGGVSKILVEKGGSSIQDECRDHVGRNGNVSIGEIYCSRAGNLPFSTIIHAVGPKWIDGTKQEGEILHALITKCLQEASRKQLASIAVPAIGTGANKFPLEESTRVIVSAVKDFLTTHPRTSICEIYFCHITLEIVDSFSRSVCQCFGEADIVMSHANSDIESGASNASPRETVMRQFVC